MSPGPWTGQGEPPLEHRERYGVGGTPLAVMLEVFIVSLCSESCHFLNSHDVPMVKFSGGMLELQDKKKIELPFWLTTTAF